MILDTVLVTLRRRGNKMEETTLVIHDTLRDTLKYNVIRKHILLNILEGLGYKSKYVQTNLPGQGIRMRLVKVEKDI